MKFGGTSVADTRRVEAVAARLVAAHEAGNRVVGVLSAMGDTTDRLIRLARTISRRPPRRELDVLVSVGECISCALAAMAIQDLGHDAISLNGAQAGIVTDGAYGKAKIVDIHGRRIHEALEAGKIVLVAGFQGVADGDEVTTLGRGGSDTTAVALAAALGGDRCEIYTDVEGVFTADPRLVGSARKLHAVSYEEMLEMAGSGAKVVQLRAVELARAYGVKVHVRSTFSREPGTWICEEDRRMLEKAIVSGITHTVRETVVRVRDVRVAPLFAALAAEGVNVETIVKTGAELVFSVPVEDGEDVAAALDGLGVPWSASDELGEVTVTGSGIRTNPGVAAGLFTTLAELGVEPELVSTSPIKIGCHVPRDRVEEAVAALHRAFGLDAPDAERNH
ncbi:MAG: aspartate kinase [Actinomycetota bacterium]|nr:aspartate kinase [Actinomycetota bacterium]